MRLHSLILATPDIEPGTNDGWLGWFTDWCNETADIEIVDVHEIDTTLASHALRTVADHADVRAAGPSSQHDLSGVRIERGGTMFHVETLTEFGGWERLCSRPTMRGALDACAQFGNPT